MQINTIEIKGFASYKDYTLIKIPMGVTGIVGTIDDIDGKSNGCLTGDTVINFNRCTLGRKYDLKHAYESYNHLAKNKGWDLSHKTFVRSFNGSKIQLNEVENIVYSGEKEVWKIILENERFIKATSDHKIMTKFGWSKLSDLEIGISEIMCDTLHTKKSDKSNIKIKDKEIWSLRYHKYAKKTVNDKTKGHIYTYYRLPIHRLIYESYLNNLTYEEYLNIIKTDEERSKILEFLDPKKYHIHHKDGNHYNNDITNLECLEAIEHLKKHADVNYDNFNQGIPNYSKVVSIEYIGIEDTYDIICKDPHRNFVANGIVVHNSGKTSVVMSLLFALYGTGSYDKTEEVWNDKLQPSDEAFVSVNFTLGGNSYIVTRGRKEKSSYLDITENGNRIATSVKEAQEFIDTLLGMDYKLFLASVFFSQGDLASFIEMDPKDRKDYVDSVIDLEVWREAGRNCTREYKKNQDDIVSVKAIIDTGANNLLEIEKEISVLTEELSRLPILRKEKEDKEKYIDSIKALEQTLKMRTEYEGTLGKSISENVELTRRHNILNTNIKNLASEYSSLREKLEKESGGESDVIDADLARAKKDKTSIQFEIEAFEEELKKVLSEISYSTSTRDSLTAAKAVIMSGNCDRCNRLFLPEEIEPKLAETDTLILFAQNKIDELTSTTKAQLDHNISVRKAAIEALNITITSLELQLKTQDSFRMEFLKAESNYKEKNIEFTTELKTIGEQLVRVQATIADLTAKVAEISKNVPMGDIIDINISIQELRGLEHQIENLNIKQGKLQKVQEEQELLKNTLFERDEALKNLNQNLSFLEVLNEAFKEIPTQILKDSVVDIEKYANEIIRAVFPKFKLKLFEDESKKNRPLIVAFEVDGKYRNYKLLSGGQQSICAIGLRIGFNRIISEKAKTSLNFLVLDEIFGSLDEVNRAEVMKLLGTLTSNFPQILVITHTEEVSAFPHTINVHMDSNGNSTIR